MVDLGYGQYALRLMADDSMAWLTGELSLPSQLHQEMDRRTAAKLSRDDLSILVDRLITDWYRHTATIDALLGKVRHLQVEVALSSSVQGVPPPSPEHYEMVKELGTKWPSN